MIKKLGYLIAVFLLGLLIYQVYDYFAFEKARESYVQQKGIETTEALRDQVDGILSRIVTEGGRLADLLGNNTYTSAEIEQIIKESSLSITEIQGVTACFEPYAFAKDQELFCPYYNKGDGSYLYVGKSYDYSKIGKGTAWYTSVRDEGAKWVEPYYAQGAKDWYIDYGIPFYYTSGPNKGKVRGTITMSFVASGFKNLIHSLSLGKTGYGMITSSEGNFLAHPINEYIGTTNLKDVLEKESQEELQKAYQAILNGESSSVTFRDENVQDESLFYYDKIPSSGWGIGLLFYKNDLLGDQREVNG
ncbi:MAG: cache domain-containing protein, partial [Saprospiraceae bacterium]